MTPQNAAEPRPGYLRMWTAVYGYACGCQVTLSAQFRPALRDETCSEHKSLPTVVSVNYTDVRR